MKTKTEKTTEITNEHLMGLAVWILKSRDSIRSKHGALAYLPGEIVAKATRKLGIKHPLLW